MSDVRTPPPPAGSFPVTVKNAFRSKATARSVFGRHRPTTNSRYRSTSRSPSRYRTWPDPDTLRTRQGKPLISAPSQRGELQIASPESGIGSAEWSLWHEHVTDTGTAKAG